MRHLDPPNRPGPGGLPATAGGGESIERLASLQSAVGFPFELQARLLGAESALELFAAAAAMLARVPGTIGAWIYQRDERGLVVRVQAWQAPGARPTEMAPDDISAWLHQRWISAYRQGHSTLDVAYPFTPPGYPASLIVPMLIGDELIGAVAVERRDGAAFPYAPEDLVALGAVAATTAQALQTLVLRQRLADLDRAPEHQELIERERREIGRELHDGIVQDLSYFQLKLEMLERRLPLEPAQLRAELRELREQVGRAMTALRQTIGALRRPRAGTAGLTGQLRELTRRISGHEPALELDLSEIKGVRLAPETERAVVGIVREALQNIRKHAQASSVRVEVQRERDVLHVVVADDGIGISDDLTAKREDHFGIEQMRELAEDMGGSLEIDSDAGRGTRVHARIPLDTPEQTGRRDNA